MWERYVRDRNIINCLSFVLNDTATTDIYTDRHTLSLHDALPILILLPVAGTVGEAHLYRGHLVLGAVGGPVRIVGRDDVRLRLGMVECGVEDRKSTRLNSSH